MVLGLPLIGSHMAQLAITITDTVMLGWYSVDALAAVTLGVSLAFVLFIVGTGFSLAILPMVASAVAQNDEVQVRRVTRMGMWLSAIYGALAMVPLIWSEPILRALGQTPEIVELASKYLRLFSIGLIPSLLVMVLKNYLAALGRAQPVLWITVLAAFLNAGLNYVLIFGRLGFPELGIEGAAIASILMQLGTLAMLVVYINHVLPEHAMFQRLWRPDPEAFGRVFRLGWPIGLTSLAESGMFSASAVMVGWVGRLELAAHGIALQLASASFLIHVGLSQAATVRAGHALGVEDGRGLRDGAKVATGLSLVFALIASVLFVLFPEVFIGLFLAPDDPERPAILAIGVGLLIMAALFQMVDGAQVVALGLLRGVQDTKVPMVHAAISYWGVGLPTCYALGFVVDLGAVGVWLGLVIGLAAASALLMHRFWTRGVSLVPLTA